MSLARLPKPQNRPQTVSRPALLDKGGDERFREFLHAFMIFSRRVATVRDLLAAALGVTGPQYEILSHVRQCKNRRGFSISEIAQRLHSSGAFVTCEVGKLHRAGLLSKTRDNEDARRIHVQLTTGCEQKLRDIAPLQREVNDSLFGAPSREEFAMLARLMPRMATDGDRAADLGAYLLRVGVAPANRSIPHT